MPVLIGITAGQVYNREESWSPVIHGQSETYTDAIDAAEGVPFILPLTHKRRTLRAQYDSLGGILLAGGNDVNPKLYDEKPYETTTDISDYRDANERQLIRWALEDKKPILAICRGMQLVNVVLGGSLHQHIPTDLSDRPNAEDHASSTAAKDPEHLGHTLRIEPDSKLAKILGVAVIKTNAHHHQAINRLAPALRAVAWTDDNVIEAIEGSDDSYLIGVQSHPESLVTGPEPWLNLFRSFVRAATK